MKSQQSMETKLESLDKKINLQKKIIMLLQTSRMDIQERKMRFALLPYMELWHIIKLADILQKESNDIANLYIKTLNESVNQK
jgi:hypothetical protein